MKKIFLLILIFKLYSAIAHCEDLDWQIRYESYYTGPGVGFCPNYVWKDMGMPLLNRFPSRNITRVWYRPKEAYHMVYSTTPIDLDECRVRPEKSRWKPLYKRDFSDFMWDDDESPLHLEAGSEDVKGVLKSLRKGFAINGKTKHLRTPLHQAAGTPLAKEVVKALLAYGAEVNVFDYKKMTPLQFAAEECDLETVRLLLDHGADVNERDVHGQTALHAAVRVDYCLPVVKALLAKGARTDITTYDKQTPLYQAVLNKNTDISQILLGQLMLAEAVKTGDRESMHRLFLEHETTIHARTENGATLLHIAAEKGYRDIVSDLLDLGADLTAQDNDGYAPYHSGIRGGYVFKDLLPEGTDINEPVGSKKQTSLHIAAEHGHDYLLDLLINEYDAAIDVCDTEGQSPLDLALMHGHTKAVRVLLKEAADINACDGSYDTLEHDLV